MKAKLIKEYLVSKKAGVIQIIIEDEEGGLHALTFADRKQARSFVWMLDVYINKPPKREKDDCITFGKAKHTIGFCDGCNKVATGKTEFTLVYGITARKQLGFCKACTKKLRLALRK